MQNQKEKAEVLKGFRKVLVSIRLFKNREIKALDGFF